MFLLWCESWVSLPDGISFVNSLFFLENPFGEKIKPKKTIKRHAKHEKDKNSAIPQRFAFTRRIQSFIRKKNQERDLKKTHFLKKK